MEMGLMEAQRFAYLSWSEVYKAAWACWLQACTAPILSYPSLEFCVQAEGKVRYFLFLVLSY